MYITNQAKRDTTFILYLPCNGGFLEWLLLGTLTIMCCFGIVDSA